MSKKSTQRRSPEEAKAALPIENCLYNVVKQWDLSYFTPILQDMAILLEMFDYEGEEDWIEKEVGAENASNVRLIRTLYLFSKFCETHTGKMVTFNVSFPKLWRRLEKEIGRGGDNG